MGIMVLDRYIGVKLIDAAPMRRGDFYDFVDSEVPLHDNGDEDGYLVVYEDGYRSWSPKDVFKRAYREIGNGNMTYGLAIEAMSKGHMVARKGWDGKGMFVFRQNSADIPHAIVENMQSLPRSVKEKVKDMGNGLAYRDQMCIVMPDGRVSGWVASSSDTFAEDWYIVLAEDVSVSIDVG